MRLTILYREHSDHAREVATFVEMMRRQYPDKKAHLEDVDTRGGAATASLHGVMQYPAVLITSFEGRTILQQEGLPLPQVGYVAGQLHSEAYTV